MPPQAFDRAYALWTAEQTIHTLLGPARAASVMLFVSGVMALLLGSCTLCAGVALGSPQALQNPDLQRMFTEKGLTATQLRLGLFFLTGLLVVGTALLTVHGFFVRSGSRTSLTLAIVTCSLGGLLLLLGVALSLLVGEVAGCCVYGFPFVWMTILVALLIRALYRCQLLQQWIQYRQAVLAMTPNSLNSPSVTPANPLPPSAAQPPPAT